MLIVGGVIAVVVIAGLAYFMTQEDSSDNDQSNNTSQSTESTTNQNTEQATTTEQGNLFTMVGSGKAQQCSMSYSGANGSGTGKMYTDGKGRGLMTLSLQTAKGNTGQSNTLVTADKVYSWTITEGQSLGFVFDKAKFTSNTSGSNSSSADPNQNFNLTCSSWTVEEAKLTVPTNVNFSSLPI